MLLLVYIIIFLFFIEIFTEDFIASQTFIFISGGSETTATVLSFVLFELAMNPELQIKVQQEISDVLSSHDFNYDAVKKMKYLEQFIYGNIKYQKQIKSCS